MAVPTAQQGRKQSLYGYANRYTPDKKKKSTPKIQPRPQASRLDRLYNQLRGQVKTQKQLEADAQRLAGTQVGSSLELVRTESQRLREDADKRRLTMMNAMLFAAGENAKMAPQILGGYQSAASGLGQLGMLATGAVGDAVRADVAQQSAALARVGQAGPNLDPSQQQGVEGYSQGFLPASNLAALGANANQGFLREVASERMGAVEKPWADYEETVADLDEEELASLKKIETTRPDLVAKILDNLQGNQATVTKSMIDIEQERRQVRQDLQKIKDAKAELDYKYRKARADATTQAQKLALDQWYKRQNVKLSAARNAISGRNADIASRRADISRQNANISQQRLDQAGAGGTAAGGGKAKTIAEVMASAGRSRRDVPEATPKKGQSQALANSLERNKIRDALFEQYKLSVPKGQWAALKKALTAWVYKLPIRAKSESGSTITFPTKTP